MKKWLLGLLSAVIVVCAVVSVPFFASERVEAEVSAAPSNTPKYSAVDARFLNMLNHNYIYDEQFDCIDDMVNGSAPAFLELREDDFVAEYHVMDYIYNMYGIEIMDMSSLNADFPQKDGYMYIIPRGFDTFSHEMVSSVQNEDGTYTVTTNVTITTHFGETYNQTAKTMFVRNEDSDFGYNIVYSEIY